MITALRNYSKAQTTRRLEEAGRPLPGRPRPTTAATRQASTSRPTRRQAGAPPSASESGMPAPRRLTVVVRPPARCTGRQLDACAIGLAWLCWLPDLTFDSRAPCWLPIEIAQSTWHGCSPSAYFAEY